MGTIWNDEQYKLVIDFEDVGLPNYEVTTNSGLTDSFIHNIDAKFTDGNRSSNPLGFMYSSQAYVYVYDNDDLINPFNMQSKYYSYMTPGRKATLYKMVNGGEWKRYFAGNITTWNGSFENGSHGLVSIHIEDELNQTGMMDISELEYNGRTAKDALIAIFSYAGLADRLEIANDTLLDTTAYTSLAKIARLSINDICHKCLVYITILYDGTIKVSNLLNTSTDTPEHYLTPDDIGPIEPSNTSSISYSKVKVYYTTNNSLSYDILTSQSNIPIVNGDNTFSLNLNYNALSIENVIITLSSSSSTDKINSINYQASANNIKLDVNADISTTGAKINIVIYGIKNGGIESTFVTANISNSAINANAETYEYTADNIMTKQQALTLAESIAAYIYSLRKQLRIPVTILSSDVEIGQVVNISGVSTSYDGNYTVTEINVVSGESYNASINLLKIGG